MGASRTFQQIVILRSIIVLLLILCINFEKCNSQLSRNSVGGSGGDGDGGLLAAEENPRRYRRQAPGKSTQNSKSPRSNNAASLKSSAVGTHDTDIQAIYVLDPSETFCRYNPKYLFYQRNYDGAVCCRGKRLPVVTIVPETTGECAISTKTGANGMLDSQNLIDQQGRIIPEEYFKHLSEGLTEASKTKLKTVMTTYLSCFKRIKNSVSPCHTPMNFQKCFLDALYYLCSYGMPKPADLPKIRKLALNYEKLVPSCYYNRRKVASGCCHNKPMPWTVTEIMEAASNETKKTECLNKMGPECDATCFLNSVGAVNDEMELDVAVFQKKVLNHFPTVKASGWMDYLGPVFLFYDEMLADMGDESSDTPHRVCRFHDRVVELHESKVDQYCSMTEAEVKELINNGNNKPGSG